MMPFWPDPRLPPPDYRILGEWVDRNPFFAVGCFTLFIELLVLLAVWLGGGQ